MPTISSLLTLSPRPTVLPFGGALSRAAAMRSLRPSSRAAVRGPRMPVAPEQQAGALRPANALAAGEGHQVEPHFRVLPQVVHRRHVRGGVVERRRPGVF